MKYLISTIVSVLVLSVLLGMYTVRPDRISFYNEPADSGKFESHINYASGGPEVRKTYGVCEAGRVISETLNLYTIYWTVGACTANTHQHLNLRWVGSTSSPCRFDLEHDPGVRVDTYGSYGHSTITGHYDQGEYDLPIPTDTLSMTVVMSHTEGTEHWTGNSLFEFHRPIGCTSALSTQTPIPTETLISISIETPTATTEPSPIATESNTSTPTPTASPEPSETATEVPMPVCCPETPTAESPPTGLDPIVEPGLRKVYLPVIER